MPEFPLSLALFNVLPVILTAAALWFLARTVWASDPADGRLAALGAGMIVAGGLAKVTWKLLAALTGADHVWLANALFPLMAPGFALLLAAVWGASRRWRALEPPARRWPIALAAIALAFAAAAWRLWLLDIPRGWFLPLLVLASLSNLALSLVLIGACVRRRRWSAAALFAVNLAMIFALQPIAMAVPKTLALHWLEQSLTAFGTGCFALAAYLLSRAVGVGQVREP
jgi:hypothetical protein